MKNKGFTLIELLAVIVILAVIILMITPRVLEVIEKSRKNVFETTANSLLRTTKQFYANAIANQENKVYEFSFEEGKKGETIDGDKLELSGTLPIEGRIVLSTNGKIDIRVSNDEYSACKGYDDYAVVVLTKAEGYLCGVNEDGSTSNNPITSGQIAAIEEKYAELQAELIGHQSDYLKSTYPVGSIYISTTNKNPGSEENPLFPGTQWEAYGQGRTLIGVGSATDSNGTNRNFNTAGDEGGAYTHTLTEAQMPSHTHLQNAHTHIQNAHTHTQNAHTHTTSQQYAYNQDGLSVTTTGGPNGFPFHSRTNAINSTTATNQNTTATNQNTTATNQNTTATNQNTGGGGAHNNIQPYITVYMWRRTV